MNFDQTPIGRCVDGASCYGCNGLVPVGQGVEHGGEIFCGESCFNAFADYYDGGGDDYEEPTAECDECGCRIFGDEGYTDAFDTLCDSCHWWRCHS